MIKKDYQNFTFRPIMKDGPSQDEEKLDQPNLILFVVIVVCAVLFWI